MEIIVTSNMTAWETGYWKKCHWHVIIFCSILFVKASEENKVYIGETLSQNTSWRIYIISQCLSVSPHYRQSLCLWCFNVSHHHIISDFYLCLTVMHKICVYQWLTVIHWCYLTVSYHYIVNNDEHRLGVQWRTHFFSLLSSSALHDMWHIQ
jgi:hypothetical protein